MSKKAYKYRLYPSAKQAARLQEVLDRNRELYNAALQERRDAYRMARVRIGYNQQAAQLPEIKAIRPEYADTHSQVLQDTLRRVDKAFKAFFQRIKNGEKPGYPRFQQYDRYDSFTVGIDLGLLHFGTLSDGSTIENPRHLRASEQKLKKLQEAMSRKKRGSK
jgi:putative transposase